MTAPRARTRNPAWTLFLEGERLVASAGADALFLLEVEGDDARRILEIWDGGVFDAADEAIAPALRELEAAGAILIADPPRPRVRLGIAAAGEVGLLAAALDRLLEEDRGVERSEIADADLVAVARGGATLAEAADVAAKLARPHFLVDLSFSRTLALGPLVFPDETACITCLAGRVRFTWGDPPAPPRPRAISCAAIAAAWIVEQASTFRELGTCPALLSRSVTVDLESLLTRAERVHRLPWCPRCFPEESGGSGAFALPWRMAPPASER